MMTGDEIKRAAQWLQAWDSQGMHRTGTDGDHAGADWLAREAARLGAEPMEEVFPLARLDPGETFLECEGTRIEGVPLFDAPPTDGVVGVLGPAGSGAPIAVVTLSPRAVYGDAFRALRADPSQRGLVVVCQGEHPGLGLLNAEQFRTPYGAPAIHVSSEAGEFLMAAAARGAPARLVAVSRRSDAPARNIVVTVPGQDPAGRPPVVVMTPRSSWWQSTAERGGGLVCWLETLRALLSRPPVSDVVLTANTGHELGHLGLDDFVDRRRGWDRAGGATWVHYGANLGAAGGALSVMSAADGLKTAMARALADAGQRADTLPPATVVPSGETRDIHRCGGRYVTLVGTSPWFHLPQDRWPHSVNPEAVARIAAAATSVVLGLTR